MKTATLFDPGSRERVADVPPASLPADDRHLAPGRDRPPSVTRRVGVPVAMFVVAALLTALVVTQLAGPAEPGRPLTNPREQQLLFAEKLALAASAVPITPPTTEQELLAEKRALVELAIPSGPLTAEQELFAEKQAMVASTSPSEARTSEPVRASSGEADPAGRAAADRAAVLTARLVARGLVPSAPHDREAAITAALVARGLVPGVAHTAEATATRGLVARGLIPAATHDVP